MKLRDVDKSSRLDHKDPNGRHSKQRQAQTSRTRRGGYDFFLCYKTVLLLPEGHRMLSTSAALIFSALRMQDNSWKDITDSYSQYYAKDNREQAFRSAWAGVLCCGIRNGYDRRFRWRGLFNTHEGISGTTWSQTKGLSHHHVLRHRAVVGNDKYSGNYFGNRSQNVWRHTR